MLSEFAIHKKFKLIVQHMGHHFPKMSSKSNFIHILVILTNLTDYDLHGRAGTEHNHSISVAIGDCHANILPSTGHENNIAQPKKIIIHYYYS